MGVTVIWYNNRMVKPLLVMDFDGVWNPLNKFLVWTGVSDPSDEERYYRTSPFWKLIAAPVDDSVFFAPDMEEITKFEGKKVTIQAASELVANVNGLIDQSKVDYMWLTTWKANSDTVLNPFLGLHVDNHRWIPPTKESGSRFFIDKYDVKQQGKWLALQNFYESFKSEIDRPPLIWVEDVTTIGKDNLADKTNTIVSDVLNVPSLVLATDPENGISRKQWEAIENWAS